MITEYHFPTPVYVQEIPNPNELNFHLEKNILQWQKEDPKGVSKTNVNGWHSATDMNKKHEYDPLTRELFNMQNKIINILRVKNFKLLQKWRIKQEKKLWLKNKRSSNHKLMSNKDVIAFMQTYQRVTQNMFKNATKNASIILNLDSNHQIKSVVYKRK